MAKSASKQHVKRKAASARNPKKRAPKRTRRKQARAATRRPARTKSARPAKKKRTAMPRSRPQKRAAARRAIATAPRRAAALKRERRSLSEKKLAPTPPSTVPEAEPPRATGRAATGGDIEAESESMISPGDGALGEAGDQERADDLARTPGVESQDSEPEE